MKTLFLFLISVLAITSVAFGQQRISQAKSKENLLNEQYCSSIFKSADGTYFDFEDPSIVNTAVAYRNVLDWLQGRVAGLTIYKTRDGISIPYLRNQRAAVYIDEIPMSLNDINFLSIYDIGMIKVIKDPFVSGSRGPGGAIAIYTKMGEDEEE